MVAVLKTFLSVVTSVLCLFSSMIFGDFAATYDSQKDGCKMNFAVISDTHVTDYTEDYHRLITLEMGLYDMEKASDGLEALVITGDITQHGKRVQYEKVEKSFSKYTPAENIILAAGNHDMWAASKGEVRSFAESEKLFIEYNKKIADRDIEKMYYSTVINGYTFIVIGSEDCLEDDPVISDEQLAWLDAELKKATADGKPVFVVSHWPFSGTHGLPNTWNGAPADEVVPGLDPATGGMGERNDEVLAMLNSYKNVILINGHVHNGISNSMDDTKYGYSSVEKIENVYSVSLPVYHTVTNRGRIANGMGFVFEVYDDEVIIRARSFSGGVWYTQNEFTIPVVK